MENYLGSTERSITLNFSKGASQIIGQYYQVGGARKRWRAGQGGSLASSPGPPGSGSVGAPGPVISVSNPNCPFPFHFKRSPSDLELPLCSSCAWASAGTGRSS